jgi:hypothetical protein
MTNTTPQPTDPRFDHSAFESRPSLTAPADAGDDSQFQSVTFHPHTSHDEFKSPDAPKGPARE